MFAELSELKMQFESSPDFGLLLPVEKCLKRNMQSDVSVNVCIRINDIAIGCYKPLSTELLE